MDDTTESFFIIKLAREMRRVRSRMKKDTKAEALWQTRDAEMKLFAFKFTASW
ncbi:hypothetical protein D3C87_1922920 [compost metagenome]